MPRKERKDREKQKKKLDQEWDEIVANAPEHAKSRMIADKAYKRLTGKSKTSKLSENLNTKGQHDAGWAKYDEHGQHIKREDPDELGANLERHENKEIRAQEIRERHRNVWGNRGVAQRIAHEEGLSVETIRRYMKDFPI
jgi:hypothetical protein